MRRAQASMCEDSRQMQSRQGHGVGAKPVAAEGPVVPEIPSLAVLPFANLTGSAEHYYLVDGIVTEIIGALGRVGLFFVTSLTSSFTCKGRAVDPVELGQELGVRNVLEGSIPVAAERINPNSAATAMLKGSLHGYRHENDWQLYA